MPEPQLDHPTSHHQLSLPEDSLARHLLDRYISSTSRGHFPALAPEKLALVFSDIDGSLLEMTTAPRDRLKASRKSATQIADAVHEANGLLVPVTGSSAEKIIQNPKSLICKMDEGKLPLTIPIVVTDGGRRMFVATREEGRYSYRESEPYAELIDERTRSFSADQLLEATIRRIATFEQTGDEIAELDQVLRIDPETAAILHEIGSALGDPSASNVRQIFLQPSVHGVDPSSPMVAAGKVALYFYAFSLEDAERIYEFLRPLTPEGFHSLFCEERQFRDTAEQIAGDRKVPRKYCLDLCAVTKSTPVEYISHGVLSLLCGSSLDAEILYFGDSGNDIPPAQMPQVSYVALPHTASSELEAAVPRLQGMGKRVFQGHNQSKCCTDGLWQALHSPPEAWS